MTIDVLHFEDVPTEGDPMAAEMFAGLQQGIQSGYQRKLMAQQIQQAKFANQLNQKYGDQDMQSQIALRNAKINQMNAPKAYSPSSDIAKLQSDLGFATQMYGKDSPQAQQIQQMINLKLQGSQGIAVYDKDGNIMVRVGGKNGGGAQGGGGTYRKPDGTVSSMPTNPTTTTAQSAITGANNADQYINDFIKTLPQFQNPITKGLNALEGFSNQYIPGSHFSLPSQQVFGMASLKSAAEGMVKNFGIRPTDKNLEIVQSILMPDPKEDQYGYTDRIKKQLSQYAITQQRQKDVLSSGFDVGRGAPFGNNPGDYINPQQANALARATGQNPLAPQYNRQPQAQTAPQPNQVPKAPPGGVMMQDPTTGKYWPIAVNNIQKAKAQGLVEVSNG